MKFVMPEINKLAISMLLFSCCGEDEDVLANAVVTAEAENCYHVVYNSHDIDAIDFRVKIERMKNSINTTKGFRYTITDSVYGDNGEFTLDIV